MCLVCLSQPAGLIWYQSINVLSLLELIPDYKHKDIFCFCFSHLVGPTDHLTKQTSPSTRSFSHMNINCLLLSLVFNKERERARRGSECPPCGDVGAECNPRACSEGLILLMQEFIPFYPHLCVVFFIIPVIRLEGPQGFGCPIDSFYGFCKLCGA